MKKQRFVLAIALSVILVLTGCAPKAQPAPTAKAATSAPAAQPVTIDLWHGWTDPNEVALLDATLKAYQAANPNYTVNVLSVPFDQLKNKFTTEASTGGGPDLLIGPKDWIGELTTANLIVSLDSIAADILAELNPAAVQANSFKGKVMALPESVEAVVMWYNKQLVPTPPKNADELLAQAEKTGLALNTKFYHSVGFLFGFGGQIFDENQRCVFAGNQGVIDFLDFMAQAAGTPNVIADSDDARLDAAFKEKRVSIIFNGPWATGDYSGALGKENVAVAPPLTLGSKGGTFAPFLGTKNVFLSANSKPAKQAAALAFMRAIVSVEIQSGPALTAGHIPSNKNVKIEDPIVAGIFAQTQSASYFPNEPEMGAVWTPAGDMITKVVEGKSTAAAAAEEAAKLINAANNK